MTSFESIRLSTDDLPVANRQDAIREHYGRLMQRMDYASLDGESMRICSEAWPLDGIMMGTSTYTSIEVARTPELLSDGADDVMLCLIPAGASASLPTGLTVDIAPGDFFLGSLNHRLTLKLPASQQHRTRMFQMPRSSLGGLAGVLDDRPLRSLPAGMSELKLLLAYARSVSQTPPDSVALRQSVSRHMIDLATLAIGASREASETASRRGVRAAQLAIAKQEVLNHLADPDLSAPGFATKLQISRRYLHMLFEAEESTFSEYVMQQRLMRAHDLLVDPRRHHSRIIDIALEAGFREIRSFNRAFRRRYGMTPSELREQSTKRR